MMCKNCERFPAVGGVWCEHCVVEMVKNGITCKHRACDNPVHKHGQYCAECMIDAADRARDAAKEDRMIERGF